MSTLSSFNPRTGDANGPPLSASTPDDVDAAVRAAASAFLHWAATDGGRRAALLNRLAEALEAARETLVAEADLETALGAVRLNGELDRTTFQLRRFAALAEGGAPFEQLAEPAVAGGPPAGHPAMVRQHVPLGPVAVFAASNFPFAFSVLGGDTASALAAGCPVVVKAHPGHPRLSSHTHTLIRHVLEEQNMPAGLIGMVQGADVEVGVGLVRHPLIAAGAFTGSTRGGAALQAVAQARQRPIPFYGELGSINPVVALPSALSTRSGELATALAGSIVLGCGQFCTNPGLVVLLDGPEADAFVMQLASALATHKLHPMLTAGIRAAFDAGVRLQQELGAELLLGSAADGPAPVPMLLQVSARRFVDCPGLHEEVFGPSSLVVRARTTSDVLSVLAAVGGSLTVTLWGADVDTPENRALVRGATSIAGRVLFAGVPTGVAVTAAQQHGGPWPASTAATSTSVGDAALQRFLRPVCLQDAPAWVLARQGVPC
jgi:acyl-CoA reductase-like NAD-dependent aldehyde dehydrogenase